MASIHDTNIIRYIADLNTTIKENHKDLHEKRFLQFLSHNWTEDKIKEMTNRILNDFNQSKLEITKEYYICISILQAILHKQTYEGFNTFKKYLSKDSKEYLISLLNEFSLEEK